VYNVTIIIYVIMDALGRNKLNRASPTLYFFEMQLSDNSEQ